MNRFARADDTEPFDLGDGDVVHLRRRMSYGDQRRLAAVLTDREKATGGMASYLIALLDRNVIRWEGPGFVDEAGKPLAVTRDALDDLDNDVAEAIVNEIARRNPTESPFAARLAKKSSPTTEGTEASSPGGPASSNSASDTAGPGMSS